MPDKQLFAFNRSTAISIRRDFRRMMQQARYQLTRQASRAWRQQPDSPGLPFDLTPDAARPFHHLPDTELATQEFGHEELAYINWSINTTQHAERVADSRNLTVYPSSYQEPYGVGLSCGTWEIHFYLSIKCAVPDSTQNYQTQHGCAPLTLAIDGQHGTDNDGVTFRVPLSSNATDEAYWRHTGEIITTSTFHIDRNAGDRFCFSLQNQIGTREDWDGIHSYYGVRFQWQKCHAIFIPHDLHSETVRSA